MDKQDKGAGMDRRGFLTRTAAAAGAGVILAGGLNKTGSQTAGVGQAVEKLDVINVGIIGVGSQGQLLLASCLKAGQAIPGLRFKAVCDIWKFNRERSVHMLNAYNRSKRYGQVKQFTDYKEMLAQKDQLDLDAVIIATPDWLHAEHAIAAMHAGLHVYCEKEMSNSLEMARRMVLASRKTKKLLQIGRQRRSNPRYINAIDKLVLKHKLLGRVMQGYAQWNRAISQDMGWPAKHAMSKKDLARHGYDTMTRLRNWRWYKRYGGGPVVDLGSHQIDILNWVFGANPKSVIASGGIDYYKHHEWYDNIMCIFEYENPKTREMARAIYQVQTTTRRGGFYEAFTGERGGLVISEYPRAGNWLEKDPYSSDADTWDKWAKLGYIKKVDQSKAKGNAKNAKPTTGITSGPSEMMAKWALPTKLSTLPHQPHLKNFFDTIRGNATLNCPGEFAYQTAVAVLAINEAVKSQKKINFKKKDFEITT